jgi:hypothetical protein
MLSTYSISLCRDERRKGRPTCVILAFWGTSFGRMPQGLREPFLVEVVSAALSLVALVELESLVDPESPAPAVPEGPVPADPEEPSVRGRFLEEGSAARSGSPAASGLHLPAEAPFVPKLTLVLPFLGEGLEGVVLAGIGRVMRMVVKVWRMKERRKG